ncbi:MAG TPA: L,D-transpeptidase, partial [Xanthobacteraceae bacterium]|nr:L,D-transpeptidase [Xanthobacteraceae bacterium]
KHAGRRRRDQDGEKPAGQLPPPQTPQQALARIDIPQDVVDHISEMMVPGSSLVVSDQGLGDETGDGTDFIVVTR